MIGYDLVHMCIQWGGQVTGAATYQCPQITASFVF